MNGDGRTTLASIGEQLSLHISREEEMQERVNSLYQTVVVGNGKPSLKNEVGRHADWINNANRFIWIVITALVGQFMVSAVSFGAMLFILLVQNGMIKP